MAWKNRSSLSLFVGPIIAFTALVMIFVCLSSIPQDSARVIAQDNQPLTQHGEREFRTGTPKHVPLKIKAKNVNSENWTRDLEVEVTNTSDKPIYFLSFSLIMQGITAEDGRGFGFWLHYGRPKLIDFSVPLESTDVPLMPKETYVLRIPEADADGWEILRKKNNKPHPMKIGLVFQSLNFGDGTGFSDAGGTFIDIHKTVGVNEKCLSPPSSPITSNQRFHFVPATFLPVIFFNGRVFRYRWSDITRSRVLFGGRGCCAYNRRSPGIFKLRQI